MNNFCCVKMQKQVERHKTEGQKGKKIYIYLFDYIHLNVQKSYVM